MQLKKIIISGPESTGKSTLCQQLAAHYNTLWCPEYAREYLKKHGPTYTYEDLLQIAKGQLQLEGEYIAKFQTSNLQPPTSNLQPPTSNLQPPTSNIQPPTSNLLFLDTDLYVMKIWCEFVFGKCHSFILEQLATRQADLYLLCNTDLPWIPDELREYPDLQSRRELFELYKDDLSNQPIPWVVITGSDYNDRLQQAINAVDRFISSSASSL